MDDSYKPTEEERRKFGRISHGYSTKSNSKFPKSTKKVYDIKKFLRDFGVLATQMKTEFSKKKFLELWYDCWKFETYASAIKHVRDNLQRFTKIESDLIENKLKEIERFANAI